MSGNAPADFGPTIARLQQIVAQSGDAQLLGNGPVQADAKLLDLCADVLRAVRIAAEAEATLRAYQVQVFATDRNWTDAEIARSDELRKVWCGLVRATKPLLGRARKLRATTPAGIFAKAQIVAASKGSATHLGMSLAVDLLASPAIRASIWPAQVSQ